jgi:hypothetical protein
MIMGLALLGLIVGGIVVARRRGLSAAHASTVTDEAFSWRRGDGPERIVALAGGLLPSTRREWGQAMAAELLAIDGHARRWRFAADVVRVVLIPPGPRARTSLVAGVTLTAAVIGAVAADHLVPELRVLAGVLGGLLTIVLASIALRWTRPGLATLVTAVFVVTGVTATIVTVVAVTVAHPAAASDPSHAFAILYAVVLCVYVVLAAATPRAATGALWWGLGGAGASSVVWLALLPSHGTIEGLGLFLWPVGGAGALLASVGAAMSGHDLLAGARAALTAAIISGPVFFTADIIRVLTLRQFVLTSPYDIAQYPHSGYPDVASFVLSDTLAGGVISVLVMYPVVLTAVGLLGGGIGSGLGRVFGGRPQISL